MKTIIPVLIPKLQYEGIIDKWKAGAFGDVTETQLFAELIRAGLISDGYYPVDDPEDEACELPPGCDDDELGEIPPEHADLHVMHSITRYAYQLGYYEPAQLYKGLRGKRGDDKSTRCMMTDYAAHSMRYITGLLEAMLDHEIENQAPAADSADTDGTGDCR